MRQCLLSVLLIFPALPCLAQSLEELKARRQELQSELARIEAQIGEQERANAGSPAQAPRPRHFIAGFGINEINSAGGVDPFVTVVNPDPKNTIKYIRVRITPYNAVGDVVASQVGGVRTAQLQYTGPLEAIHEEQRTVWEPVWYNSTVECLRIESVAVIFANGRTLSFAGPTLKQALAETLKNDCRFRPR